MNVAILGVGTVGSEVCNVLIKNKDIIFARCGVELKPVIGLVRDMTKHKNAKIPLTNDINEILNRNDIDIFVELMGGIDEPYKIVKKILQNSKPVVSANKAMLAYHRCELEKIAQKVPFCFEASVAGGIPIIKALSEGLSANNINKIVGILNGTSNYILTNMMQNSINFAQILKKAQDLGYAEANPNFDIGGFDAAHKLLILASIAYSLHAKPEDILIEGIENITLDDIYFAKEFDYTIKLIAIAKKSKNSVELRVHPALIDTNSMIAKVNGVMNGVSVFGDIVGETMYYGAGAGGSATASAVVSDLIDIARGTNRPMLGYVNSDAKQNLLKSDEIRTKYYFRLKVDDNIGILAKITALMSENNISIYSFLQKPKSNDEKFSTLYFTTHLSYEKDAKNFLKLLEDQKYVKNSPFMLRIES